MRSILLLSVLFLLSFGGITVADDCITDCAMRIHINVTQGTGEAKDVDVMIEPLPGDPPGAYNGDCDEDNSCAALENCLHRYRVVVHNDTSMAATIVILDPTNGNGGGPTTISPGSTHNRDIDSDLAECGEYTSTNGNCGTRVGVIHADGSKIEYGICCSDCG